MEIRKEEIRIVLDYARKKMIDDIALMRREPEIFYEEVKYFGGRR